MVRLGVVVANPRECGRRLRRYGFISWLDAIEDNEFATAL